MPYSGTIECPDGLVRCLWLSYCLSKIVCDIVSKKSENKYKNQSPKKRRKCL